MNHDHIIIVITVIVFTLLRSHYEYDKSNAAEVAALIL